MFQLIYNIILLVLVGIIVATSHAFAPPSSMATRNHVMPTTPATTTQLSENKWNYNEGRAPWGLKKNAEIWNGRVAQIAFVVVFAQELITGKGVIAGIQQGNIFNLAMLGITVVSVVSLTAFLAIQGDDDYVNLEDLEDEA